MCCPVPLSLESVSLSGTGACEHTCSIRKKAKGGFFVCFLTQQYVLSHIDLYLRPRKEVPGIPYHGLNILKSIPYP